MGGSKFTPEQEFRYKNLKTEIQKPVEEPKFAESFLGAAAEMVEQYWAQWQARHHQ
jgi:hypothetical protein